MARKTEPTRTEALEVEETRRRSVATVVVPGSKIKSRSRRECRSQGLSSTYNHTVKTVTWCRFLRLLPPSSMLFRAGWRRVVLLRLRLQRLHLPHQRDRPKGFPKTSKTRDAQNDPQNAQTDLPRRKKQSRRHNRKTNGNIMLSWPLHPRLPLKLNNYLVREAG